MRVCWCERGEGEKGMGPSEGTVESGDPVRLTVANKLQHAVDMCRQKWAGTKGSRRSCR